MLIGNSNSPDIDQTLTCFTIIPTSGQQLIGGSTSSPNMTFHSSLEPNSKEQLQSLKKTIFLMSITDGTVDWSKQYYNDLYQSSPDYWPYLIQSCSLSSDYSYLAVTTLYFNLIILNPKNGQIYKSFLNLDNLQPNNFQNSNLLIASPLQVIVGFNDNNFQWRIVQVPLPDYSKSPPIQQSYLQNSILMQGFLQSSAAQNTLFAGCIPSKNSSQLFFSGYFTSESGNYLRLSQFDLDEGALVSSMDGKNSEFNSMSPPTGILSCFYNSVSKVDILYLIFQESQDLQSSTVTNSNLNFWMISQNLPLTSTKLTLAEYKVTGSSKQLNAQIVSLTYNSVSNYPILLIHINNIFSMTANYILYFPTQSKTLAFSQAFKSAYPISSNLVYFGGKIFFLGNNQEFNLNNQRSKASSFLMQSTLKSDFSANTQDTKTCWEQQSGTTFAYIKKKSDEIVLKNSLQSAQSNTNYIQSVGPIQFTELSNQLQINNTFMSLDQQQLCFSYTVGERYSQGIQTPSKTLTCNNTNKTTSTQIVNKVFAIGQTYTIFISYIMKSLCPVPSVSILTNCYNQMNSFTTTLMMNNSIITSADLPSFMTYYLNNNTIEIRSTSLSDTGIYTLTALGINNFGFSMNVTYVILIGNPILTSPTNSSNNNTVTSQSIINGNSSDTECFPQRYPLFIGDSFNSEEEVSQTLTCLQICSNGDQIVGGATKSTRMVPHETVDGISYQVPTIFLINFLANGEVKWYKQYFNDKYVDSSTKVFSKIQACKVSTDQSYIALMTLPYAIILINLIDGSVREAYIHQSQPFPLNQQNSNFLYASSAELYTSYLDDIYQWRIVQIPLQFSGQLGADKTSLIQNHFVIAGGMSSSTSLSILFQGFKSQNNKNLFHFSGLFQNKSTSQNYIRYGTIDTRSLKLVSLYEGDSSDFSNKQQGVAEYFTKGNDDLLALGVANYQDLSKTSNGYLNNKFWVTEQNVPSSRNTIIMLERVIYSSGNTIIFMADVTNTEITLFLFIIKDLDAGQIINLIFIPSKSKFIQFKTYSNNLSLVPTAGSLQSTKNQLCFTGYNYQFNSLINQNTTVSYLFCSQLNSDFSPNFNDEKNCWVPQRSTGKLFINNNAQNSITLNDVTSKNQKNLLYYQYNVFQYVNSKIEASDLQMVLDQIQPCYDYKINLTSTTNSTKSSSSCQTSSLSKQSSRNQIYNQVIFLNSTFNQSINFTVLNICPSLPTNIEKTCQTQLDTFYIKLLNSSIPSFMNYTKQRLFFTVPNDTTLIGTYPLSFFIMNKYGMTANITLNIIIKQVPPILSQSTATTTFIPPSSQFNSSDIQCISKRYPMLFGDAFTDGVKQSLTCFQINAITQAQIIGGQTTSPNVAYHAQMTSQDESITQNIKNTIFLISIDNNGEIQWHKQYYNDLISTQAEKFVYYIQSCKVSSDSSYIVLLTRPYYLIAISLFDGSVIKTFLHSSNLNPNKLDQNNFLYAHPQFLVTGYIDDQYQWSILQIPLYSQDGLQTVYQFAGFNSNSDSKNQLFSGCASYLKPNQFYFAGYYQDKSSQNKKNVRFISMDLTKNSILSIYEGTNSDLTSDVAGLFNCYFSKKKDLMQIIVQNSQSFSSHQGYKEFTFWGAEYTLPLNYDKLLTINQYQLYGYQNAIAQITGADYRNDSGVAIYLIQLKDFTSLTSSNIIFFPSLKKWIQYRQPMSSFLSQPMISSIKYTNSKLCYIGYQQDFSQLFNHSDIPFLYLHCSQLTSDYSPNKLDVRSCWQPLSSTQGFKFQSSDLGNFILQDISTSFDSKTFTYNQEENLFEEKDYEIYYSNLLMILDQQQACYSYKVGVNSTTNNFIANSSQAVCNSTQINTREVSNYKQYLIGKNVSTFINFSISELCYSLPSAIIQQCQKQMNSFQVYQLSQTLPSFINYNLTTNVLKITPPNKQSIVGLYELQLLAYNKYGMSINYTYQFDIVVNYTNKSTSKNTTNNTLNQTNSSTNNNTVQVCSSNINSNFPSTECIPKRYPMFIGDAFTDGVTQQLTCFDLNNITGSQIVGGSTNSQSMLQAYQQLTSNTIFLISIGKYGQIEWANQYYYKGQSNDGSQINNFQQIQSCKISLDSDYIALVTSPSFYLLTICLSTGKIKQAYVHNSLLNPTFIQSQKFLYPTSTIIFVGYTDDQNQWVIVQIPLVKLNKTSSNVPTLMQTSIQTTSFNTIQGSPNLIFGGCIPQQDSKTLYIGGYYQTTDNKKMFRIMKLGMLSLSIMIAYEGTTSDFMTNGQTGLFNCYTKSSNQQGILMGIIQQGQDMTSSSVTYSSLKFWPFEISLPLSSSQYILLQKIFSGGSGGVMQIVGSTYNADTASSIYLILSKDFANLVNQYVIYIPSSNKQIVYQQSTTSNDLHTFSSSLIYSSKKNTLCFIGNNQVFSDYIPSQQPVSYLMCTSLNSNYSPNMADTSSCWIPNQNTSYFNINTQNGNTLSLLAVTSNQFASSIQYGDLFSQINDQLISSNLTMVLDQYQPCYQFALSLQNKNQFFSNLSANNSSCNRSSSPTNLRNYQESITLYLGYNFSQVMQFTTTNICPISFNSTCKNLSNATVLQLQTTSLPSFMTYNSNTLLFQVKPLQKEHIGEYQVSFFAMNVFGMSVNFTMKFSIVNQSSSNQTPTINQTVTNSSDVQCIAKRYPMLIGDAFSTGVQQSLTCFDYNQVTNGQLIGGQTTSTSMALHAQLKTDDPILAKNIQNTIFIISIDPNGQIMWGKQYYNDLYNSDPKNFIYYIQTCQISNKNLVIMTKPYNIIIVSLFDGSVVAAYRNNQIKVNLNQFLYTSNNAIYTGYTNTNQQWSIIQIPLSNDAQLGGIQFNGSLIQAQFQISGLAQSSNLANNSLFQGCIPQYNSKYFYFSGYYQDANNKTYLRYGLLDYQNMQLAQVYDGSSSNFTSRMTGLMQCSVSSSKSDIIQFAASTYQDLSSTSSNFKQFNFWISEQTLPYSQKTLNLVQYEISGYTNTLIQLSGMAFKSDSSLGLYLIQVKDLMQVSTTNIIFFPSLKQTIQFKQKLSSSYSQPFSSTLKYNQQKICFIGHGQEFPDYLSNAVKPASYLFCSQLRTDYQPNSLDVRSCWLPLTSNTYQVNQVQYNALSLQDSTYTSQSYFSSSMQNAFDFLFQEIQSSDLSMILDQYQPCFEVKIGLNSSNSQVGTGSTAQTCNPNNGNMRNVQVLKNLLLGQNFSQTFAFSLQNVCPAFPTTISDQCYYQMNQFNVQLLTQQLPSHISYNSTNLQLQVNTSTDNSSQLGVYNISILAMNKYGMSTNYTYQINIVNNLTDLNNTNTQNSSNSTTNTSNSSSQSNYTMNNSDINITCIPKKYPMLIGDSFLEGVNQTLTCFDLNSKTKSQIIGGSTTSKRMTYHAMMDSNDQTVNQNIQSTIFLMSIGLYGQIEWSYQYYYDLYNSNPELFFYYIQSCQVSSDQSYIALMTLPFNILTINIYSGQVIKSYVHSNLLKPNYFNLNQFIYPTRSSIYTGYTDKQNQWNIVQIPLDPIARYNTNGEHRFDQAQLLFNSFSQSSQNVLFDGFIPQSDPSNLYYAGYYQPSSEVKSVFRLGLIDISKLSTSVIYEGSSSDIDNNAGAIGMMKCIDFSASQSMLMLVVQNYQDFSSNKGQSQFNFWILEQAIPLNNKQQYNILEKSIVSTTPGVFQVTGLAFNNDQQISFYLIQYRDIINLKTQAILFVPNQNNKLILYEQPLSSVKIQSTLYSLQYMNGQLCFIGSNQEFSSLLLNSKPASYLFCSTLTSDYSPNKNDYRSCWTPESSSSSLYVSPSSLNSIIIKSSTTNYNMMMTVNNLFTETTQLVQSSKLLMILDQIQPCYEHHIGINQTSYGDGLKCNTSFANQRGVIQNEVLNIGNTYTYTLNYSLQYICPSFVTSIQPQCNSYMNRFSTQILSQNLPKFFTSFNQDNLELQLDPTDISQFDGTTTIQVLAINAYGMSQNFTLNFTYLSNSSSTPSSNQTNNSNVNNSTNNQTTNQSTTSSSSSSSQNNATNITNTSSSSSSSSSSTPSSSSSSQQPQTNTSNATNQNYEGTCIPKRYPILIGDNHQQNIMQTLTCFDIDMSSGNQIVGGSTSSPNMTYHSQITAPNQYLQNKIANTIFLISFKNDGTVAWRKQYFNDLQNTRADQYFNYISNCKVSTDYRYIAITTDPFNLIAISLTDGSILKSYVFRTQQTVNFYDLQRMILSTSNSVWVGYTDENYQWRIISVPVPSDESSMLYIPQQQILFQGFKQSAGGNSLLFQGCTPQNDPSNFYFAGFFANQTNNYIRFGHFDLFSLELQSAFDGTSKDLGNQATGFFECSSIQGGDGQVGAPNSDYMIMAIQNYVNMSQSLASTSLTFWVAESILPLSQTSYSLKQVTLQTNTKTISQITGITFNKETKESIYLIQSLDLINSNNYNILYFYKRNMSIMFNQQITMAIQNPLTSYIKYYQNQYCFIGYNQVFPQFISTTKPSSFLQCSFIPDYYYNANSDNLSCWKAQNSSSSVFTLTQSTNSKSAINAISVLRWVQSTNNYLTFQDDIFVEMTGQTLSDNLFMVLDKYQPCLELRTTLNLNSSYQPSVAPSASYCKPSFSYTRSYFYKQSIYVGQVFSQYLQPAYTYICPSFNTSLQSYCSQKMNNFQLQLLQAPPCISYDQNTKVITASPKVNSDAGIQVATIIGVNDFGISINITYVFVIAPIKQQSATASAQAQSVTNYQSKQGSSSSQLSSSSFKAQIQTFNSANQLIITFQEPIIVPKVDQNTINKAIQVQLSNQQNQNISSTWNVSSINQTTMIVQVGVIQSGNDTTKNNSSEIINENDLKIQLFFINPKLFISAQTLTPIDNSYLIFTRNNQNTNSNSNTSNQNNVFINAAPSQTLQTLSTTQYYLSSSTLLVGTIVSIISGPQSQMATSFASTMQTILYTTLSNISLSQTSSYYLESLRFSTYDFLPFNKLLQRETTMKDNDAKQKRRNLNSTTTSITMNFNKLDYRSIFLFNNCTNLIVIQISLLAFILLYSVVKRIIYSCCKVEEPINKTPRSIESSPNQKRNEIQIIEPKLKYNPSLTYSILICYIKQSYSPLFLFSLVNLVSNDYTLKDGYSIFNLILSLTYMIIIIAYLCLCIRQILLFSKTNDVQTMNYHKFAFLFEEFKTTLKSLMYQVIQIVSRITFAFVIVILQSQGIVQITLLLITELILLTYLLVVRPFKQQMRLVQEVINEVLTSFSLITCYFFSSKSEKTLKIGSYIQVVVISAIVIMNVILIGLEIYSSIKNLIMNKLKKKKIQKSAKIANYNEVMKKISLKQTDPSQSYRRNITNQTPEQDQYLQETHKTLNPKEQQYYQQNVVEICDINPMNATSSDMNNSEMNLNRFGGGKKQMEIVSSDVNSVSTLMPRVMPMIQAQNSPYIAKTNRFIDQYKEMQRTAVIKTADLTQHQQLRYSYTDKRINDNTNNS